MARFDRPEEILTVWEEIWGKLTSTHRERFLQRQEIARLLQIDTDIVRASFSAYRKLADTTRRSEGLLALRSLSLDAQPAQAVTAPIRNTLVTARRP